MPTIDSLDIQITAQAKDAEKSLKQLVKRLSKLSTSLMGTGSASKNFANGVNRLTDSVNKVTAVDPTKIDSLARNVRKLSGLNVTGLQEKADVFSRLAKSFRKIGSASKNATRIGTLASNLSKLGYKSIGNAVQNMPALANSLKNLMITLSKAPKVSRNVIAMTNALARLAGAGRSVGSSARSLTSYFNRYSSASNVASKSTRSLAASIGKLYANFWLLVRGARGLWNAITSTADYIEAYNYFNVAFGKIGSEWSHQWEQYGYENAESYANSFADRMSETLEKMSGLKIDISADGTGLLTSTGIKNLGLNIQEMTQAASNIAAITNSVGQTGEISLAASQSLTALAGDISSLFNQDYSTVMSNLQSGLIGQSRALYKYGIDITNATLQTYAYEMGLSKAVSEMTQAEKMQLRLIAILDQSKVAWGDLANTINSPSNMIRQFKNNIAELGMTIGQLFMPVLSKVLPIINALTIALTRLMVSIAGFFGISLDLSSFGQGFSDIEEDIGGVSDSLDDVSGSAKKAKAGLRGFDELKTISMPESSGGGGGGGAGGGIDLTGDILKATDEYMKVWEDAYTQMENKAQQMADNIEKALEPVKKLFKDISIGDWFAVGGDVSTIVSGIFNFFARAIDKVNWEQLGRNMGNFLAGINWTDILSSVGRFIWEGFTAAIELWASSFSIAPFETALLTFLASPTLLGFGSKIFGFIVTPFTNATGAISTAITNIGGMLTTATGLVSAPVAITVGLLGALAIGLGAVFATNKDVRIGFENATTAIKEGLQPAVEFFTNDVLPDLRKGWDKLMDILSPLATFVKGVLTDAWQKILNPALSYIGETLLPIVTETFENFWNNVLVPLGNFIGSVFTPVVEILSDVLSILWENVVLPLTQALGTGLSKAFEAVMSILHNGVIPVIGTVIDAFMVFWQTTLSPLVDFLWGVFGPAVETVFGGVKNLIEAVKGAFSGLMDFISGVFAGDWAKAWEGIKTVFSSVWDGIVTILKTPLNSILSMIEGAVNGIIDAFNWVKKGANKIKFSIPSWVPGIGGKSWGINLSMTSHVSVPRFEYGGFPDSASLFWANENGIPELVGTMGGRPAVASGMEITGIRDEIRATANEEMALLRQQNQLLQAILQKEFGITTDQIGRSARAYAEDYFRRTGDEAYSF